MEEEEDDIEVDSVHQDNVMEENVPEVNVLEDIIEQDKVIMDIQSEENLLKDKVNEDTIKQDSVTVTHDNIPVVSSVPQDNSPEDSVVNYLKDSSQDSNIQEKDSVRCEEVDTSAHSQASNPDTGIGQ